MELRVTFENLRLRLRRARKVTMVAHPPQNLRRLNIQDTPLNSHAMTQMSKKQTGHS